MKNSLIAVFLFISLTSNAQDSNQDSLLGVLRGLKNDTNKVEVLIDLAKSYEFKDIRLGIKYCNQAKELSEQLKWNKGKANALAQLGYKYYDVYKYDSAKIYLNQVPPLENNAATINAYDYLGYIEEDQGFYSNALKYYWEAFPIAEETNDTTTIQNEYNNIGSMYLFLSDYSTALKYLNLSLELANAYSKEIKTAGVIHNIGLIYIDLKDYKQASKYFIKSLRLNKAGKGYESWLLENYLELSTVKLEVDSQEIALNYLNEARILAMKLGSKNNIAAIDAKLGDIELLHLNYITALDKYETALNGYTEINENSGIGNIYLKIGELYLKQVSSNENSSLSEKQRNNLIQKSILNLEKALSIFEELEILNLSTKTLELLSEAHAQSNNLNQAYSYLKLYNTSKEKLLNDEKSKELGKQEQLYQARLDQKEQEQLKRAKELEVQEIQSRRNTLQYSGITIFTILVFITLFFISKQNISLPTIDTISFLAFLLIYEFILVFADPYIDSFSEGIPIYKLLLNFSIALILIPIHRIEAKFKQRFVKAKK